MEARHDSTIVSVPKIAAEGFSNKPEMPLLTRFQTTRLRKPRMQGAASVTSALFTCDLTRKSEKGCGLFPHSILPGLELFQLV